MKGNNVEKSVWMVHVEVLKDMKKQLEELKKINDGSGMNSSGDYKSIKSVKEMEDIVAEQVSVLF